jgi:hypothetical protein
MKRFILLFVILIFSCNSDKNQSPINFITVFESSKGTETASYHQTIQYYKDLADSYKEISIQEIGETDSGKPLHIVTLNPEREFDFDDIRKNKRIILINNGIHPGESDGIDATMMFFRDIVQGKIKSPGKTVLVTIPIYNVGGSLNRNSTTRTNQNGPKEYGFRGNARNYDLNRDFIKSDTKNARTFAQIFHLVQPDVFIDNHVSNGADYQYVITHLFTQHDKLGGKLGEFVHKTMQPIIEEKMSAKGLDMTPYVNVFNDVPEKGFSQYLDSPRYSTGYTSLFNTLGMMVETHMLKPYKQRVEATYEIMKSLLEFTEEHHETIAEIRKDTWKYYKQKESYPLSWEVDTTKYTILNFKGYEGVFTKSDLTGAMRLKYDRTKPFTKEVVYQNYFKPSTNVSIPEAYVIPQGWWNVIELLKINNIEMTNLDKDSTMTVELYKIANYKTRTGAYEGHFPHYNTTVSSEINSINFVKGDFIIYTDQPGIRYLLETLEPHAPDSFFNWNFFDSILQRKEYFSPYVWEDKAKLMLLQNPKLQIEFNLKKTYDQEFASNWYAQLNWLHQKSEHYEKSYLQYPVYRVMR